MLFNRQGFCGQAFFTAVDIGNILMSSKTFFEFLEICNSNLFLKFIPKKLQKKIIREIQENCTYIHINEQIFDCADQKLNNILELAICGKANTIISFNKKLLSPLNPYRGIKILSPIEFLESERQFWLKNAHVL